MCVFGVLVSFILYAFLWVALRADKILLMLLLMVNFNFWNSLSFSNAWFLEIFKMREVRTIVRCSPLSDACVQSYFLRVVFVPQVISSHGLRLLSAFHWSYPFLLLIVALFDLSRSSRDIKSDRFFRVYVWLSRCSEAHLTSYYHRHQLYDHLE